ncbi:hypothetical protein FSP39_024760 [Pinctada imbricata]|uniref:G-patch domain-containing protein n=1 Tax=Pinctada imbricata TaxID=66713 RepID=A0AA88YNI8_PINIB|nr:hypothetical protein FSP39_024760 [Pinctada imbricata]
MELLKDIIYSHIVLFFICEAQSANNNNNTLNNNTDDYDFYNDDYDFYSDDYDFYSDDYDFYSDDYDNDYDNDYGHGPSIDTTTIYAELEEDYCADFYMCNSSSFIRTCNCDAMCEAYGDCCFEANLNNDLPSITDKERELTKFMSCKLLPDVYDFWYMFVIDSCPPNSNYQHNKLCTNVDADDIYSITPATGKESGMIYRNMFCAMCHKEEFSLWIPEIFCSRNTPYTGNYTTEELLELDECRKNFLKSDSSVKVRMCHPFVSTCFSQNNGTSFVNLSTDACESFDKKVVFTPEKVYKNKYCYMCDDNRAGKVSCDPRVHNLTVSVVIRGDLYSLRLLFNLQDRVIKRIKDSLIYPRETEEVKLNSNCSTGHAFDPFAKTCRTIFCADEEKIENGKCVRMPTNVSLNSHSELCDSIQFKESEYVQHNETSITVLLSNKTYHGVHIENKTAFVCKNIRNTYQKRYSISDSEGILSLICNTISILFLIITICTYSFRQMRNMAGKILLGLSTSLCMAQLFFVLAPLAEKIPALCTIVAICIHYFYLSSFVYNDADGSDYDYQINNDTDGNDYDYQIYNDTDGNDYDYQIYNDTDGKDDDNQIYNDTDGKDDDNQMYNNTDGSDYDYQIYNDTDENDYDYSMHNDTDGSDYYYSMHNDTDGNDYDYQMYNDTDGNDYDYSMHNDTDGSDYDYKMNNDTDGNDYDYQMYNDTDGNDYDYQMYNDTDGNDYDYFMHNRTDGNDYDYSMYNDTDGNDYGYQMNNDTDGNDYDYSMYNDTEEIDYDYSMYNDTNGKDYDYQMNNDTVGKTKPEKKVQEYVIPLIRQNRWQQSGKDGGDVENQAVQELLDDAAKQNGEWQERGTVRSDLSIPLLMQNQVPEGYETDDRLDVSLRPNEPEEADYDEVPIEQYGMALLKGMGWKEGDGIGKNNKAVAPVVATLRPKGMGLGADRSQIKQLNHTSNKKDDNEDELVLKKGSHCVIVKGSNRDLYGVIEGLDEDNCRVMVKLALSGKIISQSQYGIKLVTAKEYKKYSKYLNKGKADEYKEKEEKRSGDKERSHHKKSKHHRDRSKERERSHSKDRDDREERGSRSAGPMDRDSSERTRGEERLRGEGSRDTDSSSHRKRKYDERHSNGHSSNAAPWVRPHIKVRLVDKNYKKGRYYKEKVTILDMAGLDNCVCKTDDGKVLDDIPVSSLETVIPKSDTGHVLIVNGKHKGQVAQIMKKDKKSCQAAVQLLSERDIILKLSYDDICEYTGDINDLFEY